MKTALIPMLSTTSLTAGANALGLVPTPAERAAGRFMRAPDHGADGGDGGAGGDQGGAAGGGDGGGGTDAGGDGGAGAGEGGGADGGDGGAAGGNDTLLGSLTDGDEGAAVEGEKGEGEGSGEGSKEGDEGDGAAIEVLGAPEKYDLKVPEAMAADGMTFDAEAFALVEEDFRALDLSNDAAQKLLDGYATKVLPLLEKRAGERADTFGAEMRRGWEADARKDPDIGGAKFEETKALARQTLVRFGVKADSPLTKLLEESGLGSHPDMLRFFANVGRATGEATVDAGDGGGEKLRLADRVYGKPAKA